MNTQSESASSASVDTTMTRRVLIADDDGHIREVLRFALSQAGYEMHEAVDGRNAWELFDASQRARRPFDLVVLDILMPGLDGLDVCRRIRQVSTVPIIFLTSRDEELDRILGLELGADDYVTKPFSPRELVARAKAAMRRYDEIRALAQRVPNAQPETSAFTGASDAASAGLRHGTLLLDLARHECRVGAQLVVLTVSEFGLLQALMRRPGHVQSREQLVHAAYGEAHFLSDRTVDSHMRRIRQKLRAAGLDCIETVYGVGYRLDESA